MLAVIRPDSWNFPLLLHVGGAMILVGALVTASAYMLAAWNRSGPGDQLAMNRIAFKTLLIVGIPGFLLMRTAAEWIRDKEGFGGDDDPAWIGVGYITSDLGGLLLLISTLLARTAAEAVPLPDNTTVGGTAPSALERAVLPVVHQFRIRQLRRAQSAGSAISF